MIREEAIKQLNKLKSFHNGSYGEAINFAIESIKVDLAYDLSYEKPDIQSSKQETQWIPVKERLPEKDGEYLITSRSGINILSFAKDLYKVDEYDFCDKKGVSGWWWYDSEYGYIETDRVIAWMPLPQPYKESEG